MKVTLKIEEVLIYSDVNDKYFHTKFGDKLNVIYGKNTAGKSTLIQLLLYAFGINDNKTRLSEILTEEIFIRLDCNIISEGKSGKYVFIRQGETLVIKEKNNRILRFNGIGSDNSEEHKKLKSYFNELFGFTLMLESKSGLKKAPIETIFLPYYVSQDVGWVYLRKSFSNLTFYKNFKEDFLDYYLGIENSLDRNRKREIEAEIKNIQQQIKFFSTVEEENQEFEISKIVDDAFTGKANEFIETLSSHQDDLLKLEQEFIKESNKLTFYNQRASVVSKVKRNHKKQKPGIDHCPTCTQVLPKTIDTFYEYLQGENDTLKLQGDLKDKIKKSQSRINSITKNINKLKETIKSETKAYTNYSSLNVTFDSWIKNKANLKLHENIFTQVGKLKIDLDNEKEKLNDFKTDDEIWKERRRKSSFFKKMYQANNQFLGVPNLKESRFNDLYTISSFPFQGVQLHLAVLSYHFAFNKLLSESTAVHRLPFILDSIFKEDIDGGTKNKILKFITQSYPKDTQTILSIADDKNIDSKIKSYSDNIFKEHATLICIGGGTQKKALLKENDNLMAGLIENSFEILETI